jgi:hypothetical protein
MLRCLLLLLLLLLLASCLLPDQEAWLEGTGRRGRPLRCLYLWNIKQHHT